MRLFFEHVQFLSASGDVHVKECMSVTVLALCCASDPELESCVRLAQSVGSTARAGVPSGPSRCVSISERLRYVEEGVCHERLVQISGLTAR